MTLFPDVHPKVKFILQTTELGLHIPLEGSLVLICEDGRTVSVTCTIQENVDTLQSPLKALGYLDVDLKAGEKPKQWICVQREDYRKIKKEAVGIPLGGNLRSSVNIIKGTNPNTLKIAAEKLAASNKKAYLAGLQRLQDSSKGMKKGGKEKVRVFHVLTSVLITPFEMGEGIIKLAFSCTKLALGALMLLTIKGVHKAYILKEKRLRVKLLEILNLEKTAADTVHFVKRAAYQARIALLQLIPFVGAQLAVQYRETGSLRGFSTAPAVAEILERHGISPLNVVYGARSPKIPRKFAHFRTLYNKHPVYQDQGYLAQTAPGIEKTKEVLERVSKTQPNSGVHIRIPVPTKEGGVRYHDGTMFLTTTKGAPRVDAPTVIMYHGNYMHRDLFLDNKQFEEYLKNGYNVLFASYAGDYVTSGDGKKHIESTTECSETLLREDALADIAFLNELQVKKIGLYGFSLGGAQAMNCAQQLTEQDLEVDFITLNKTFSNAPSVVRRAAINLTGSSFLGALASRIAKRFFLKETEGKERDGCDCLDNVAKLKEVVTKKQFQHTKYTFIGATEDPLMAEKKNPENNFAVDLYMAIYESAGERAKLDITLKGHNI